MINIMFICYGNICRSPMAEFVFKKIVKDDGKGKLFNIKSSATSSEELGNPVYPPVQRILDRLNIDYGDKRAVKLKSTDYAEFDFFLVMDDDNYENVKATFDGDKDKKVHKLLEYANIDRDVLDPWYTRDFEACYRDIDLGCRKLYEYIRKIYNI